MRIAIGLGSNLGDRRANLELAIRQIAARPGIDLVRASRFVRTPPMRGGTASGWFLNGVALLETQIPLDDVLALCVELEARSDRRRSRYWGDRALDLDVLLAEGVVASAPRLTLPHPGLGDRPFFLGPLLEVWPDAVDPRTGEAWALRHPAPGPRPALAGIPAVRRIR